MLYFCSQDILLFWPRLFDRVDRVDQFPLSRKAWTVLQLDPSSTNKATSAALSGQHWSANWSLDKESEMLQSDPNSTNKVPSVARSASPFVSTHIVFTEFYVSNFLESILNCTSAQVGWMLGLFYFCLHDISLFWARLFDRLEKQLLRVALIKHGHPLQKPELRNCYPGKEERKARPTYATAWIRAPHSRFSWKIHIVGGGESVFSIKVHFSALCVLHLTYQVWLAMWLWSDWNLIDDFIMMVYRQFSLVSVCVSLLENRAFCVTCLSHVPHVTFTWGTRDMLRQEANEVPGQL